MQSKYSCSLTQDKIAIGRLLAKEGYVAYDFKDVFIDVTSKGRKIKTNDYCKSGRYPIVDQSNDFIGGYIDDKDDLFEDFPVIIFGDHTRCLKYVDFPFHLGADGVKVLKNRLGEEKASTRFLYYYLKNIDIPNTGYNRHFKYIKEILFVLPSLKTQKKIVEVLDKAQGLIDARKEQIRLMDELIQSVFNKMFGDPVTNPKGWEAKKLESLGALKNGMNFSSSDFGISINCLGVGDFKSFNRIEKTYLLSQINLNKMPSVDYLLQDGDIVFVRSNGNKALVGRSVIVYPGKTKTTFSGFCIRLRLLTKVIHEEFLNDLLHNKSFKEQLLSNGRGVNISNLNQQMLSGLKIIVPPLERQAEYIEKIEQIKIQKKLMEISKIENECNYNSIMQRAFKGELLLVKS